MFSASNTDLHHYLAVELVYKGEESAADSIESAALLFMERGHPVRQRAQHARYLWTQGPFALRAQADRMSVIRDPVATALGTDPIKASTPPFELSVLPVTLLSRSVF